MKPLFIPTKRFALRRLWRRVPREPVKRPEVYHVPVWMGTQLTPFPVFLKTDKRQPHHGDFYDQWE